MKGKIIQSKQKTREAFRIFFFVLLIFFPTLSNMLTHASSVLLVLLTLGGIFSSFYSKDRPPLSRIEKWIIIAFGVYFAVYFVSFITNAILGNIEKPLLKYLDHEFRMLFLFPIYLLLVRIQIKQWILWACIITGASVAGIYALMCTFWLFPGMRVSASYHSIAFGDISIVLAFMSLAAMRYFFQKHAAYIAVPLIAFFLGIIATILSETRGAWIAIPSLLLLFFIQISKLTHRRHLSIVLTICLIFVGISTVYVPQIKHRLLLTYNETHDYWEGSNVYSSSAVRIEGWLATWQIFKEHPIIGAGPGSFKPLVHKMLADGKRYSIISIHSQPHSAYLSSLAECGVLGLLALLGLFLFPMWLFISTIKYDPSTIDVCYAGLVLVVGFIHFGLTETIFSRNININFYIVMLSMIMALLSQIVNKRCKSLRGSAQIESRM